MKIHLIEGFICYFVSVSVYGINFYDTVCAANVCVCGPEQYRYLCLCYFVYFLTTVKCRCLNGTCVDSLVQCATHNPVCPITLPYLCLNQTCVSSFLDCTAGIISICTFILPVSFSLSALFTYFV